MKSQGNSLVAAFAVIVLCASCLGQKARENVLLPQLVRAWAEVKVDVDDGIKDAIASDALPNPVPVQANVDLLSAGLKDGDESKIAAVDTSEINAYGERGIEARVAGRVEPPLSRDNSVLLFERLHKFIEKVRQFVGQPASMGG